MNCYQKGVFAWRAGLGLEACPYQADFKPAEDWREGWRNAASARAAARGRARRTGQAAARAQGAAAHG